MKLNEDDRYRKQVDIARAVGLAPSAVLERLRKLEARGIITEYTARVNPRALGLGMLAFVAVRSEETTVDSHIAELRKKLEADPAEPVHIVTVYKSGYRFQA